ncbi:MAG: hypothetical protein SF123_23905 [Chloroflexota bacterium]|nr:hypothetical protein [Chloroflexota bacterium]
MEILKQITEQTGISETQAQQSLDGLTDTLRGNLPGPVGDVVGNLLSGGAGGQQNAIGMDDLLGMLGGAQGGQQAGGVGDLLGGLLGGAQGGQQAGGVGDLIGGLLGGAQGQQAGGSAGLGLDDLIGMIAGGGAQGGLNPQGLVEGITGRSGVSPDIAAMIIPIVLQFLQSKLPPEIGSLLGGLLGGQTGTTAGAQDSLLGSDGQLGMDDIARGIGGLLGGR